MALGTSALLSTLVEKSATLTERIGELEGSPSVRSKPALAQRLRSAAQDFLADIFAAESAARSARWKQRQEAVEGLSSARALVEDMASWLASDARQGSAPELDQLGVSLSEVRILLQDLTTTLSNDAGRSLYRMA
jgi:hypothetical protein